MKHHVSFFILTASIFVSSLFTSCRNPQAPADKPAIVKTATVKVWQRSISKSYPARVEAASNINLAFRIAGLIAEVPVTEGQKVKKGALLARIDPRDYQIQLQASQAKYEQVKAEVERIESLHQKNKVSDNDYDKALAGLKQITAKYHADKNALNDTRLTAPFDGYVQDIMFDSHETVDAGMPVVSLVGTRQSEVITQISASDYLNRDNFREFHATATTYPGIEFPLSLKNIAHQANLNGLYTAYFTFSGPDENSLTPGMSAQVTIHFKETGNRMLIVPSTALFERNNESYLYTLNPSDTTLTAIPVSVQQIKASGEAIVTGALNENDQVVAAGVQNLQEDQKVTVLPTPAESNIGRLL